MKAFSKFERFRCHRAGFNFTPPYGLYSLPITETHAILCYLSAGLSAVEEGIEHVSFCVRKKDNLRFVLSPKDKGLASSWDFRWPTMDELKIVRETFFESYEVPALLLPDQFTQADKRNFTLHLWHRPDFPRPPKILLDSML